MMFTDAYELKMMNVSLRQLTTKDEAAFLDALEQWDNSPGFLFSQGYVSPMKFSDYLELLLENEKGNRLPPGYVPATVLLLLLKIN